MQVCKLNGKCYGLTLACTRFTILIRGTIFNKFDLFTVLQTLFTKTGSGDSVTSLCRLKLLCYRALEH